MALNRKMKKILLIIPESLLIVSVLFYWVSTANTLNPIAIGLVLVLILQIIFKNKVVGIIISLVLILACIFMLLALFSELNEFQTFNSEAQTLLFIGLAYFLLTIGVSGLMIYKYGRTERESKQQTTK